MKRFNFSCEELREMIAKYSSGKSFKDLSIEAGCGTNTVRAALLACGVKPNVGRSISNKRKGMKSPSKGLKRSLATKLKMSNSFAGRVPWNKGTPHSEETILKIKAAWLKRKAKRLAEPAMTPLTEMMRRKAPSHILKNNESVRQASKRFIHRVLKATGKRKNMPSSMYLGYSTKELISHLGAKSEGDHIDHIVPVYEFIRLGITDVSVINALPNLRYLNGLENQKKSRLVPVNAKEIIAECIAFSSSSSQRKTIFSSKLGYMAGLESKEAYYADKKEYTA